MLVFSWIFQHSVKKLQASFTVSFEFCSELLSRFVLLRLNYHFLNFFTLCCVMIVVIICSIWQVLFPQSFLSYFSSTICSASWAFSLEWTTVCLAEIGTFSSIQATNLLISYPSFCFLLTSISSLSCNLYVHILSLYWLFRHLLISHFFWFIVMNFHFCH